MPRHVALLRGVSPMNCKMPELKRAFEHAGFSAVRTLLSSGNVAFDAPEGGGEPALEQRAEAAMQAVLGRGFHTIVRPQAHLQALAVSDPYAPFDVPPGAKRVLTFSRRPLTPRVPLPLTSDGAAVLCVQGREAYCAYVPGPQGPVFMRLIEQVLGKDVTTRTWDTLARCAQA
jgi:uncharacterized protein (DUF1697 family)